MFLVLNDFLLFLISFSVLVGALRIYLHLLLLIHTPSFTMAFSLASIPIPHTSFCWHRACTVFYRVAVQVMHFSVREYGCLCIDVNARSRRVLYIYISA